jgi:uracil phosphoribosyltransferase
MVSTISETIAMIRIIDHPLVKSTLSILRDRHSTAQQLRNACHSIGFHLAIEASRLNLTLQDTEILTPLEYTVGYKIANQCVLLPIMRAGLVLLNPFLKIIPYAKVGYIGINDEHTPTDDSEYYFTIPKPEESHAVFVMDVTLATGNAASTALSRLQLEGYENIVITSIIAAPEGVERIRTEFPRVAIVTAALDRELNDNGYILPGMGNASDRLDGIM